MKHIISAMLLFCLLLRLAHSEIITMNEQLPARHVLMRRIYLYTQNESPGSSAFKPSIKLDLQVTRSPAATGKGVVDFSVIPSNSFDEQIQGCDQQTKLLIISPPAPHHSVQFEQSSKVAHTDPLQEFPIAVSSGHGFVIGNCDETTVGDITITGTVHVLNPFGYIPAELYYFIPFYMWMAIIYVAAVGIWLLLNFLYWGEVMSIQHFVSGLLILCFLEMLLNFWYFSNFNTTGLREWTLFGLALLAGVLRRTVSRMLVTTVSMGLGVSRASLEKGEKNAIIALGVFYFLLDGCFELATQQDDQHHQDRRNDFVFLGLNFAVACVDGVFYSWIFVSLSKTLSSLKSKQQQRKLLLYQRFTWVLIASLVSAVGFAIYQVYYTANEFWRAHWGRIWLIEGGFWNILYTVVLFAVVTLWRPSAHSKDYAFRQQIAGTEAEANKQEAEHLDMEPAEEEEEETELADLDGDGDEELTGTEQH